MVILRMDGRAWPRVQAKGMKARSHFKYGPQVVPHGVPRQAEHLGKSGLERMPRTPTVCLGEATGEGLQKGREGGSLRAQ